MNFNTQPPQPTQPIQQQQFAQSPQQFAPALNAIAPPAGVPNAGSAPNTAPGTPSMVPKLEQAETASLAPVPALVAPTAVAAPAAPTATPTYVVYNEYTNGKLSCSPPEKKTVPGTGPSAKPPSPEQNYFNIPLLYNFASDGSKSYGELQLEGCEMTTALGLRSQANAQTGRVEHSMMTRFDMNNPEQARFLQVIDEIHAGSAYIVQQYKVAVKMPRFNAEMAQDTGFKHPVYRPLDEVTGQPSEGRQPSMFFKLFQRGKAPFCEQTMFTDVQGKVIPWTLLQNVEMRFIPLLHFKRVYVGGGKISLQIEMLSAIVTSIKGRGTTTNQMSTISRLQQARPELVDSVAAQLAKLTSDRQDQLLAGSVTSTTNPQEAVEQQQAQPTFSGIVPNRSGPNTPGAPSTAQLPPPGALPNIGAIPAIGGAMPSIGDFTGQAPTRPTIAFN